MRNKKLLLTIFWAILVLVLLTLPMKEFETHEVTYYDKLVHFVLFGVFSYLVFQYSFLEKNVIYYKASIFAFLSSAVYALILEYSQNFVPGRTVDELDLIFGLGGAGLAVLYTFFIHNSPKPKLLLHICCIGCGVYISQILKNEFKVSLYFYNPNIFPLKEYEKRLEEIKKVAKIYKLKIIIGDYNHDKWREMVRGREADPERGERCMLCYRERLEKTAKYAHDHGFHFFATTLTTSPHKNAQDILRFGQELGREYEIGFLERDFKKNDGFKKAAEMSKKLELYRQDYCGCEFSLAEANLRKNKKINK